MLESESEILRICLMERSPIGSLIYVIDAIMHVPLFAPSSRPPIQFRAHSEFLHKMNTKGCCREGSFKRQKYRM